MAELIGSVPATVVVDLDLPEGVRIENIRSIKHEGPGLVCIKTRDGETHRVFFKFREEWVEDLEIDFHTLDGEEI